MLNKLQASALELKDIAPSAFVSRGVMAGRGVELTMPAWMTAAGQQQTAPPGSQQPGSMALALVAQPTNQDLYDLSDYDSSDSENQDDFLPPGPLEAEKCTLSGPGFTGGAAGSPVSFVITAKDGRSKRIRDGGAYVRVQVQPMRGVSADPVDPSIKDHGDGSYTVTYSVSTRGNYELSIELNGSPIGGNPFPVYFSPPDKNASSPAPAAEAAAAPASNASAVTSAAIAAAGAVSAGLSGGQQTFGADGQPLHGSLATLGAQAHAAGVLFPSDDDTLHRTILIANINPLVNTEQVKQLFGFCGQVKSCRMVGNNQFAFVEYSSPGEANAAMGLHGQMLGDRALKVENSKSARETTPQGASNAYTAIQLQQMQQLQLAQMQSSTLAAQVAQLRALAKTNPNAPIATMSANSASQKAAALAAAALLQKKFGQTSGPGNADHAIGKRRSPSPDRRHHDRRRDERRHDSRDRRAHDSRDRRRSRSREHRSERTQASANRRREADRLRESKEQHRHASRGRHESAPRDRDRRSDRSDRSRERHERSRRDRSAERRHGRDSRDRARSKDRDLRRRSDSERRGADRHRSSHRSISKEAERQKADAAHTSSSPVQADTGKEAAPSGKAGAEPAQPSDGAPMHDTVEAAADHRGQVGEKRSRRDDASASPNRKSPSRNASQSPIRSPRHKHSKKHKKEHLHKKGKRDKHDHDAVDRPDDKSEQSGPVSTSVAAAETGVQADMTDDLQALRQAALQTTKSTKSVAGVDTVADGASQPAAAEAESVSTEPMDTV